MARGGWRNNPAPDSARRPAAHPEESGRPGVGLARGGSGESSALDRLTRPGAPPLAEGREQIHRQRDAIAPRARPDSPRPDREHRDADAALVEVAFAAAPAPAIGPHVTLPAVVAGEDHERVLILAVGLERRDQLPDARVQVLDQSGQPGALRVHPGRAPRNPLQPLGRRLERDVRRVVGEVEEEGLGRVLPLVEVTIAQVVNKSVACPAGRSSAVAAQVVDAVPR